MPAGYQLEKIGDVIGQFDRDRASGVVRSAFVPGTLMGTFPCTVEIQCASDPETRLELSKRLEAAGFQVTVVKYSDIISVWG